MKAHRVLLIWSLFFWGIQSASSASGELAIIVNNTNDIQEISVEDVASIFLGKSRQLPDGTKVVPLDQLEGSGLKQEFYAKVVRKTLPQLNSYWSRLIFTGRGQPPFAVSGNSEVLEFIASNPNMIGYVDVRALQTAANLSNVKVLLTIQ
ncbi:MAG: phosphate ABC transporter substrate-binding protein [Pseudomonadales bacterium]|jgi:ABC-type phosphate transport system substrate-binding protein|uniref:phosphate ABC transporter substrate-binding protein n=1 Tax=unclassified Ketobacter TaxID=2639109 RepID=UPI000C459BA9|nr:MULTISPECIES: phosphate ABC transporter substrate-binding protein [unclassified Ketobacter]MAA58964.1 phosphate ABC transporter substrate-binding protein [Pseudomonadales bacterium]MEC8811823.1 phosphate ABC transporter substrate-binding protein [Pseudomonadota bacterium]HAG96214.1 phosphate ABC transporter substrate-binding protein [Gammaproteobacteria bacterium]MAQ26685.1 phosphate ABC transporter substrate-binding protein [Pseudomonadales bacterium]MBI26418.1 phosphate ABC transporter su|tara:strand:- start:15674 stop:16123 length:450 start_codon:yes stop_codon:yes gene_type:complete